MLDCTQMTFEQMSDIVRSLWLEVKRRNPIGVNFYKGQFAVAIAALDEIGEAEKENPTCEAGPGID